MPPRCPHISIPFLSVSVNGWPLVGLRSISAAKDRETAGIVSAE